MTPSLSPALLQSSSRNALGLNGSWSFALDPNDEGQSGRWFDRDLSETITVPGSWEEQGFGERPFENIGGWTKRRSYEGTAWYGRTVEIPAGWTGRRVWLQLSRVSWESAVWVNGERVGECNSLSTPHRFDLTGAIRPGKANRIAIRVTNNLNSILNYEGHIHSRHTATTWGGIIGAARLVATPPTWIEDIAIYPEAASRNVRCVVQLAGTDATGDVHVTVRAGDQIIAETTSPARLDTMTSSITCELQLGESARLWSDHDPFLYALQVELRTEAGHDVVHDRFGLRDFSACDRQLILNGQQIFLRGYVDCCIFPLTGYPPDDSAIYADQFACARSFGFNHVRLHSWVPSHAFFDAADEAGMLVQCELPNWSNCNDPGNLDQAGGFLRSELERVVRHLQRHPSLVIHSMGNELLQPAAGGTRSRYSPFLNELVQRGRELDPSRLYLDQSGFGYMPEEPERDVDLFVFHTFRGSAPDTTTTWWERIAAGKTPVIAHEHTQMDMYARFSEIEKFTGIMEPSWLLQAKDGLGSKGLLGDADLFVDASAQLQIRCIKELFERVRRTPDLCGIQMLNLTDFPGQGSALNGVLDAFWDEKGHVTPEEFRRFNDETVLLCSCPRRTFPTGGRLSANLLISHFGQGALNGDLAWELTDDNVVAKGQMRVNEIQVGRPWPVCTISAHLPMGRSRKLTLTATLTSDTGVSTNNWDFWVFTDERWQPPHGSVLAHGTLAHLSDYYPMISVDDFGFLKGSRRDTPKHDVIVSDVLHVRYVEAMYNGATLVYLAENDELHDGVESRFESLFWSYLWFPQQPNQTMGLTIEDHPVLSEFPHDGHSDWQWFHLVDGATALGMDQLPLDARPIVGGIDNWNRGKSLGYLLEARVGKGRFLMTTLKLLDHYPTRPEAVSLLNAMLRYVHSELFAPKVELTLAHLWSIPKHPTGWPRP